jgi:hypothetical protein
VTRAAEEQTGMAVVIGQSNDVCSPVPKRIWKRALEKALSAGGGGSLR